MPPPPPPGLRGLVPPSHFVLRPRSARTLEAELEVERGRGQALEAELEAEKRRGQDLEAELAAERGRGRALEAELEAERGRGRALEAELEAERGRGQALGHILTLQEQELSRELPPEEVGVLAAPPRLRALLGRWRDKAFALLVQLRARDEAERGLRAQVAALGAAVAEGTRRVTRLELRLRHGEAGAELQRRDSERLAREAARQRGRAEAAEEALRGLAQLAARLAAAVAAREAEVTAATGAIGTLSARLRRAGQRLRLLRRLVAPAVARRGPRRQGDAAGTGVTSPPRRRVPVPSVPVPAALGDAREVTRGPVTQGEDTPRRDRTGHPPGRAALGSLVRQLQALGAAILGDSADPPEPPGAPRPHLDPP